MRIWVLSVASEALIDEIQAVMIANKTPDPSTPKSSMRLALSGRSCGYAPRRFISSDTEI